MPVVDVVGEDPPVEVPPVVVSPTTVVGLLKAVVESAVCVILLEVKGAPPVNIENNFWVTELWPVACVVVVVSFMAVASIGTYR